MSKLVSLARRYPEFAIAIGTELLVLLGVGIAAVVLGEAFFHQLGMIGYALILMVFLIVAVTIVLPVWAVVQARRRKRTGAGPRSSESI